MAAFVKPRVVVSECLGFAACRYNGAVISGTFAERMRGHVTFRRVCPEMEIGLGCPRDPIRVVVKDGRRRLVQPATGRDVSEAMLAFASQFLDSVGAVDGFLLKGRSPSCGIKDVKEYGGPRGDVAQGGKRGFFGGAVLDRFGDLAVEDEGRLNNFALREHFLTKLFTLAAFRTVRSHGRMRALVRFQTVHKGLLMAYSQTHLGEMGRIVANRDGRPPAERLARYREHLVRALARPPRFTSIINVLMHALGHVSDGLKAGEKAFFLDHLERYRTGKVPLSVLTTLLRSWAVRFEADDLLAQSFLQPYPEALVEITDSGKGRGA